MDLAQGRLSSKEDGENGQAKKHAPGETADQRLPRNLPPWVPENFSRFPPMEDRLSELSVRSSEVAYFEADLPDYLRMA